MEKGKQPFTSVDVVALLIKVVQKQQTMIAVLMKEVAGVEEGEGVTHLMGFASLHPSKQGIVDLNGNDKDILALAL